MMKIINYLKSWVFKPQTKFAPDEFLVDSITRIIIRSNNAAIISTTMKYRLKLVTAHMFINQMINDFDMQTNHFPIDLHYHVNFFHVMKEKFIDSQTKFINVLNSSNSDVLFCDPITNKIVAPPNITYFETAKKDFDNLKIYFTDNSNISKTIILIDYAIIFCLELIIKHQNKIIDNKSADINPENIFNELSANLALNTTSKFSSALTCFDDFDFNKIGFDAQVYIKSLRDDLTHLQF